MTKNRNLSVGIFVSLALATLVVFTIWITGKRGTEPLSRYSILIESDVSGLMLGGPVYFLGVGVGEVIDLTIVPGSPVGVQVDIEILESTPVDQGTWATLAAQGITGVSVINLSNDPGARGPLPEPGGGSYPMIPFRDSGFSAILSSVPEVLHKVESLLDRAAALLDEDNARAVASTLENLETVTASLSSPDTDLTALARSVQSALGEIQSTVQELRGMLREAGPGLNETLANLDQVTRTLADVTARLGAWVDNNDEEMQAFVGDGLGQVPALIADARQAMGELQKLLEEMRRDPSGLIYQAPEDAVPVEED